MIVADTWPPSPGTRTSRLPERRRRSTLAATLKVTHKAIGVEVRRGTYEVVIDGERVGSLELNDTFG
jgi:hypothetical protein